MILKSIFYIILVVGNTFLHALPAAHKMASDLAYIIPNEEISRGLSWQRPCMTLTLSGFIRETPFYDSRQLLGFRENLKFILPAPQIFDQSNFDTNERSSFSIISMESRVRLLFNKAQIGAVDATGYIEIDYQGPWLMDNNTNMQLGVESGVNGATLRHAVIRLGTKHYSLLTGLYWHPFVIPESGPYDPMPIERTPFESASRAPQVRFTARNRWIEGIFAAASQFDYRSNGPTGFSAQYIRNAVIPNIHTQVRFYFHDHIFGIGADFKRLVPQISVTNSSGQIFATKHAINSFSVMGYGQLQWRDFFARFKIMYGQNVTDHYMLPGYGVHAYDVISMVPRFTPIAHLIASVELFLKRDVSPGIFFGISKNQGSSKSLATNINQTGNAQFSVFGFGGGNGDGVGGLSPNYNALDYLFEIAPRVIWTIKPLVIVGEFQYWKAVYGLLNNRGTIDQKSPVSNIRCLASISYNF